MPLLPPPAPGRLARKSGLSTRMGSLAAPYSRCMDDELEGVDDGAGPGSWPPDLNDPTEIAEMVRRFYADVAQDDLLGPMFNEVAQVDWAEHLPKLTAFWCRALLSMPG